MSPTVRACRSGPISARASTAIRSNSRLHLLQVARRSTSCDIRLYWMTLLGVGLLALPVAAQPPEEPGDGGPPPGDPAMKQKLLDAFDTNKDGNDRPSGTAGDSPRHEGELWRPGVAPAGQGQADADRKDDVDQMVHRRAVRRAFGEGARSARDRRGPDRIVARWSRSGRTSAAAARMAPMVLHGPPNPERLFNRFDENKDESLSRDEFKKLTDFVREHRPMGPPRNGVAASDATAAVRTVRRAANSIVAVREGATRLVATRPAWPAARTRGIRPAPAGRRSAAGRRCPGGRRSGCGFRIESPLAPGLARHGSQPARGRAFFVPIERRLHRILRAAAVAAARLGGANCLPAHAALSILKVVPPFAFTARLPNAFQAAVCDISALIDRAVGLLARRAGARAARLFAPTARPLRRRASSQPAW